MRRQAAPFAEIVVAWSRRSHQACQPAFSYKHNDNFLRKQGMSRPSMVKQARLHKQFLRRSENQVEGCTPSYKLKLKRCTQHLFDLIISSWVHTSIQGARVSPWWEQWLEHSPPTNMAQASSPGVDAICGLALFLVLSFARRVFFFGFCGIFPPPTIYFSLGRKRWIHKRSQKKI